MNDAYGNGKENGGGSGGGQKESNSGGGKGGSGNGGKLNIDLPLDKTVNRMKKEKSKDNKANDWGKEKSRDWGEGAGGWCWYWRG